MRTCEIASLDQFQGCLLGLSLGDALGAPFEGGVLERLIWRVIGKTSHEEIRWTDDTQMTIDLIESFLDRGEFDAVDLAARFASSYRWDRGYGPGTAKVLKRIKRGIHWQQANRSVYPRGSFGNGAAMRAPILGLIKANRMEQLADVARQTAIVTHAHPIALEGAVLVAVTTALATQGRIPTEILKLTTSYCSDDAFTSRLAIAQTWLESGQAATSSEIARYLGRGVAADKSCVTAAYLGLRFLKQPFLELLKTITRLGGDADTIGAMAGAIWGAANGATKLPAESLAKLEQRERLTDLAGKLHQRVISSD